MSCNHHLVTERVDRWHGSWVYHHHAALGRGFGDVDAGLWLGDFDLMIHDPFAGMFPELNQELIDQWLAFIHRFPPRTHFWQFWRRPYTLVQYKYDGTRNRFVLMETPADLGPDFIPGGGPDPGA